MGKRTTGVRYQAGFTRDQGAQCKEQRGCSGGPEQDWRGLADRTTA